MGRGQSIIEKTAQHIRRKQQREEEVSDPECTFSPNISRYSSQLSRTEPVHARLFRLAEESHARKQGQIFHSMHYDLDTGRKLFQPKVNTTRGGDNAVANSMEGEAPDVVAGERLHRQAVEQNIRLRRQQIAELLEQEFQSSRNKMSENSRRLARKKLERELQAVFKRLNTSGSGTLSFEEISIGMSSIVLPQRAAGGGEDWGTQNPDVLLWQALDPNGLGHVSLVQFLSFFVASLEAFPSCWSAKDAPEDLPWEADELAAACGREWINNLTTARVPHGHSKLGNERKQWASAGALITAPGTHAAVRGKKAGSRIHITPDERECTFSPKLTQKSRQLDSTRISKDYADKPRHELLLMRHAERGRNWKCCVRCSTWETLRNARFAHPSTRRRKRRELHHTMIF